MTARRAGSRWADDRGSAPVEFVLVGVLLTALALAVVQLALALHVRNTVLDAAAEGARYGALADNGPADGVARTRELIRTAVGDSYAEAVVATSGRWRGQEALTITVTAPLPALGLFGPARSMEVSGHAAVEAVDER